MKRFSIFLVLFLSVPTLATSGNPIKKNMIPTQKSVITKDGQHFIVNEVEDDNLHDYVPNQILVKFKDTSDVSEVADILVEEAQDFETITDNDNIDRLNRRYNVREYRKALRKFSDKEERKKRLGTRGQVTKSEARTLRQTMQSNRKKRRADRKYNKLRVQGVSRSAARKQSQDLENQDDLANLYVVELETNEDVKTVSQNYENDPNVEFAQPNYIVTINHVPDDPFFSSQGAWGQQYDDLWALKEDKLNMEKAWDLTLGYGAVVAVVDTGLDYNHEDIKDNVWINEGEVINGVDDDGNGYIDDIRGWDFADDDNDPMDDFGHGTHVAGTIAAMSNDVGVVGVAPLAKIMPLKGFSTNNSSTTDLAEAIMYAADNGADVINNSWGCRKACPSNPTAEKAARYAHEQGAVVIFSAGNSNADVNNYSPQNIPETITVASTDVDDTKSPFSNHGYHVDVAAPGGGSTQGPPTFEPFRGILSLKSSAAMSTNEKLVVGERYIRQAGTSMSAPHVSGLAALIKAYNPQFTNNQIRQAIIKGSDDIGEESFDTSFGYGRINAYGSLMVEDPLELAITEPGHNTLRTGNGLVIRGSLNGKGLVSGELLYYPIKNPDKIQRIDTIYGIRDNDVLLNWQDARFLKDGKYMLILRGYTATDVFEVQKMITVQNVAISSPQPVIPFAPAGFYRTGDRVVIEGVAYAGNIDHYDIKVYDLAGNEITDAKINLANQYGTSSTQSNSPVDNSVLATWDTTGIKASNYVIKLLVVYDDSSFTERSIHVSVDPMLREGWPVYIENENISEMFSLSLVEHLTSADINNDGANEILVGYGNTVRVLDSKGNNIPGWPQSIGDDRWVQVSPTVGDITGDGKPNILIADQKYIHAWHGDGSKVEGWPKVKNVNRITIANLDGDKNDQGHDVNEIIGTQTDGSICLMKSNGEDYGSGCVKLLSLYSFTPTVADLDGDGFKEIIVMEMKKPSRLFVLNHKGELSKHGSWPKKINTEIEYDFTYFSAPVTGDLDRDGDLEIVVGSYDGKVFAFHHDGSLVDGWPVDVDFDNLFLSTAAIGDITGDEYPEIVMTTNSNGNREKPGKVYVFQGDGTRLKGWPYASSGVWNDYTSTPIIADVDNDYVNEVVVGFGGQFNSLIALNGDKTVVDGFPRATGWVSTFFSSPLVEDIDGDGLLELAWIDAQQFLYLWDLPTPTPANVPRAWPMYRHDAQLTASADNVPSACEMNAPEIVSIPDQNVMAGKELGFQVALKNSMSLNEIDFNIQGLPDGATFDPATGVFNWKTSHADSGKHVVQIEVRNTCGEKDMVSVTLMVGAIRPFEMTHGAKYFLKINMKTPSMYGYSFTPQVDGVVSELGGYLLEDSFICLWDAEQQTRYACKMVKGSDGWSYASIDPVNVKKGKEYLVVVQFLNQHRAGYWIYINNKAPVSINDKVTINHYLHEYSNQSTFSHRKSVYVDYALGGMDIGFIPNEGLTEDDTNNKIVQEIQQKIEQYQSVSDHSLYAEIVAMIDQVNDKDIKTMLLKRFNDVLSTLALNAIEQYKRDNNQSHYDHAVQMISRVLDTDSKVNVFNRFNDVLENSALDAIELYKRDDSQTQYDDVQKSIKRIINPNNKTRVLERFNQVLSDKAFNAIEQYQRNDDHQHYNNMLKMASRVLDADERVKVVNRFNDVLSDKALDAINQYKKSRSEVRYSFARRMIDRVTNKEKKSDLLDYLQRVRDGGVFKASEILSPTQDTITSATVTLEWGGGVNVADHYIVVQSNNINHVVQHIPGGGPGRFTFDTPKNASSVKVMLYSVFTNKKWVLKERVYKINLNIHSGAIEIDQVFVKDGVVHVEWSSKGATWFYVLASKDNSNVYGQFINTPETRQYHFKEPQRGADTITVYAYIDNKWVYVSKKIPE